GEVSFAIHTIATLSGEWNVAVNGEIEVGREKDVRWLGDDLVRIDTHDVHDIFGILKWTMRSGIARSLHSPSRPLGLVRVNINSMERYLSIENEQAVLLGPLLNL
ncbi:hypothetical protein KEM54_001500, partial [Ascosphaera aggregata]